MTKPQAVIRLARLDDARALHYHCYPESSFDDVREYLAWCLRQAQKGWVVRLVAEVDGQAVGNAQLTVWGQEGEIGSLVVAQAFRRRGLARRLLAELIAEAERRDLAALEIGVHEHQPAIFAFYQRLGFRLPQKETNVPPHTPGRRGRHPEDGIQCGDICPCKDKKGGLSHPACPKPVVHLRMLLRGR